jgi:hypothetical protein
MRHFVANRDSSRDWQTRSAMIGEKFKRRLRAHFHLPHHVGKKLERRLARSISAKTEHGDKRY